MEDEIARRVEAYLHLISHLRQTRVSRKARLSDNHIRQRLSKQERSTVLRKTGGLCHICGGQIQGDDWQADHVLAHSSGGTHVVDNYLAAHAVCNNYRWDYLAEEFQEILKLGVWLRTQIEKQTSVGRASVAGFIAKEWSKEKRRKPREGVATVAQPAVAADRGERRRSR